MSIAKYVYYPLAIILFVNTCVTHLLSVNVHVPLYNCLLQTLFVCKLKLYLNLYFSDRIGFFKIDGQILIPQYETISIKDIAINFRRSYFKYLTSNQHKCDITDCIISTCIVPKCPLFPGMTVYNQFAGNIFNGRRSKFCNIRNVLDD